VATGLFKRYQYFCCSPLSSATCRRYSDCGWEELGKYLSIEGQSHVVSVDIGFKGQLPQKFVGGSEYFKFLVGECSSGS
jgi:hypothetical protein